MKYFICFLFFMMPINSFAIEVVVVSRSISRNREIVPFNKGKNFHLAIFSEALSHGVWEVGPDAKGNIVTTNTVSDLERWDTNIDTQRYKILGNEYIKEIIVKVNKKGLLDAIDLYERAFKGDKFKEGDDNYAVSKTIYGAGGPTL